MASNGRLAPWLGVLSMAAMSVGGWSYLFMRHPPFPDGQFAWDEGNPKSKVDHPFNHAFETSRELAFGPGKFGDPSIAGSYPAAPAPPAVAIELPKPSVGDFASLPVSNPEPAFGISGESIRGHDREAALAEQRTPANPTEESAGMLQSETSQSRVRLPSNRRNSIRHSLQEIQTQVFPRIFWPYQRNPDRLLPFLRWSYS